MTSSARRRRCDRTRTAWAWLIVAATVGGPSVRVAAQGQPPVPPGCKLVRTINVSDIDYPPGYEDLPVENLIESSGGNPSSFRFSRTAEGVTYVSPDGRTRYDSRFVKGRVVIRVYRCEPPPASSTQPPPRPPADGPAVPPPDDLTRARLERELKNILAPPQTREQRTDIAEVGRRPSETVTLPGGRIVDRGSLLGAVAVRDQFVADLRAFQSRLRAQHQSGFGPLSRDLLGQSGPVFQAFKKMMEAKARALDVPLRDDNRRAYDLNLKQAAELDKQGPGARDAYGLTAQDYRNKAANAAYGVFVTTQRQFFGLLDMNPLLGIQLNGTYLFQALQTTQFNALPADAVPALVGSYLLEGAEQAGEAAAKAETETSLDELLKYGGPRFSKQQQEVALLGGPLIDRFVTNLQGTYTLQTSAREAEEFIQNNLLNLGLGFIAAGSLLIPVAGPFLAAGATSIQVYRDGNELVIAYLNEAAGDKGANAVTSFTHKITDEERTRAAAGAFAITLVGAFADLSAVAGEIRGLRVVPPTSADNVASAAGRTERAAAAASPAEATRAGARAEAPSAPTVKPAPAGAPTAPEVPGSPFGPGAKELSPKEAEQLYGKFIDRQDRIGGVQEVQAEITLARKAGLPEEKIQELTAGYNPNGRAANNKLIAEGLLEARLRHLGYDLDMPTAEFNRLQGISVRANPRGAGLAPDDIAFLTDKLVADPGYLDKLPERGYLTTPDRQRAFAGGSSPKEGFIQALDPESVQAVKDAYKKAGGQLPGGSASAVPGSAAAEQAVGTVRLPPGTAAGNDAAAPAVRLPGDAGPPPLRPPTLSGDPNAPRIQLPDNPNAGTVRLPNVPGDPNAPRIPSPGASDVFSPRAPSLSGDPNAPRALPGRPPSVGAGDVRGEPGSDIVTTAAPGMDSALALSRGGLRLPLSPTLTLTDLPQLSQGALASIFQNFLIEVRVIIVPPAGGTPSQGRDPLRRLRDVALGLLRRGMVPWASWDNAPGVAREGPAVAAPRPVVSSSAARVSIEHADVSCTLVGQHPRIDACLNPAASVARARVNFRSKDADPWYWVEMQPDSGCFGATLPKPQASLREFQYYVDLIQTDFDEQRRPERAPDSAFRTRIVAKEGDCGGGLRMARTTLRAARLVVGSLPAGGSLVPSGFSPEGVVRAAGGVDASLVATGATSGPVFQLQAVNETAESLRLLSADALVVQPVQPGGARPVAARVKGAGRVQTDTISGYCADFAKPPPPAGTVYRMAEPALQERFRPMRSVLGAGRRFAESGRLHPDSEPRAYADSIKQWALWTSLEGWDEEGFRRAFVERTRKNFADLKRPWTRQVEDAVRAAVPNRWRDIAAILAEARGQAPR